VKIKGVLRTLSGLLQTDAQKALLAQITGPTPQGGGGTPPPPAARSVTGIRWGKVPDEPARGDARPTRHHDSSHDGKSSFRRRRAWLWSGP